MFYEEAKEHPMTKEKLRHWLDFNRKVMEFQIENRAEAERVRKIVAEAGLARIRRTYII